MTTIFRSRSSLLAAALFAHKILGVKKTSASNVSNDVQDDIPLQEDCDDHGVSNQIKVFMGVPWTPKEFIEQASNLQHPKHIVQSLDMFLKEVIYEQCQYGFPPHWKRPHQCHEKMDIQGERNWRMLKKR